VCVCTLSMMWTILPQESMKFVIIRTEQNYVHIG